MAAALPGGDPLAAGETPSPEVVANAGPTEGMRVPVAMACLAFTAIVLAALCVWSDRNGIVAAIPLTESPEVLAGRAREYARGYGYNGLPTYTAVGWEYNWNYLDSLWQRKSRAERAAALGQLQPPAATFWYRQHPTHVYSYGAFRTAGGRSIDIRLRAPGARPSYGELFPLVCLAVGECGAAARRHRRLRLLGQPGRPASVA